MHGGSVTVAHAACNFARALQARLDRILQRFVDAARGAQQFFDAELALAEQIACRTRARGDRRQQVRTRVAVLLLLRELIGNPFNESVLRLEAGTGHHLCDLPGIEKTAKFSSLWPAVQASAQAEMRVKA